jgi:carbon-monoxide dehydrogenase large subunit
MVADPGRLLNPLIVEGQLHGGIAQGVGQALLERVVYDGASGQLLSGSLMDFALPRADDLPAFATAFNVVPAADHPLGAKGIGEGPTTGSPPAVVNAVLDALAGDGVTALDMPLTPERVWRALHRPRRA